MADNVVRTERVEPSAPLILSEGITRAAENGCHLQLINPRVGQARDSQSGLEEDRI